MAQAFGYVPCKCGKTDGTVACEHKTASKMISAAVDWLDKHEGRSIRDTGEFTDDDTD